MLKSILVALQETKSGEVGQELAIQIARRFGAAVTGLGILHESTPITPREMLTYRAERLNPQHMKQRDAALEKVQAYADAYAERCKAQSVACTPLARSGHPYPLMARESQIHDLVVVGRELHFAERPGDDASQTVSLLLRHNVRPLIVTPRSAPKEGPILVAYDGSLPSARALQLFTLLGLASSREIHVLSIDDEADVAADLANIATSYLQHHDIEATAHGETGRDAPVDTISAKVKEIGAGLLVVGAFGHSGWREAILGSATTTLLRYMPVPIFVSS